ncbi:hypothetical protein CPB84DRAFT_377614 [Gymnopilus junonius]|uniref:Uncharacterized protein n=1 Tax=Gymnopilus junonius TaxID=109634 RepID=A0A9P5NDH0_GYMJU|nr:hypothetical protein CPB84DRAFT_377614 [Gymnopilus junonius]
MQEVESWKSGILREVYPGPDCVSDKDLKDFITNNLGIVWCVFIFILEHDLQVKIMSDAVSSCSMLP